MENAKSLKFNTKVQIPNSIIDLIFMEVQSHGHLYSGPLKLYRKIFLVKSCRLKNQITNDEPEGILLGPFFCCICSIPLTFVVSLAFHFLDNKMMLQELFIHLLHS